MDENRVNKINLRMNNALKTMNRIKTLDLTNDEAVRIVESLKSKVDEIEKALANRTFSI